MITLYFKSIDAQQQLRSFDCQLYELETVLDTLNLIAAAGSTFLEVYIIENGHRTNLAPQAFDGQNMTTPIQRLQAQWESLLAPAQPKPKPHTSQPLLEMMLDRIDQYETLMAEYDSSIAKLEGLMVKAEEWLTDGPRKNQLLTHYHTIVARHYQSIERAQTQRDKCLIKLARLKPAYLE